MITGDEQTLHTYIHTHRCPDHDQALSVVWDAKLNTYVIRCGAGHYPEEIQPIRSLTEEYKQTDMPPGPVKDRVESGLTARRHTPVPARGEPMTALLPRVDLETGSALTQDQIKGLIAYAAEYGLDAYRGHVVMMHGKPYIGLDGYCYHATQVGRPYRLVSRPLKPEERPIYQVADGDYAWEARVIMDDGATELSGLGIVPQAEMTARSAKNPDHLRSPVVAAHPWQIAQKRAEWQAMRRAFPIGRTTEAQP